MKIEYITFKNTHKTVLPAIVYHSIGVFENICIEPTDNCINRYMIDSEGNLSTITKIYDLFFHVNLSLNILAEKEKTEYDLLLKIEKTKKEFEFKVYEDIKNAHLFKIEIYNKDEMLLSEDIERNADYWDGIRSEEAEKILFHFKDKFLQWIDVNIYCVDEALQEYRVLFYPAQAEGEDSNYQNEILMDTFFLTQITKGNEMDNLKQNTVIDSNIVFIDGAFRYVNHIDKLATTGFTKMNGLLKNADIIRFDEGTLKLMRERHNSLYSV